MARGTHRGNLEPRETVLIHAGAGGVGSAANRIKPFVGKTIDFEELPNGLEDMAERRTVGRTVVTI